MEQDLTLTVRDERGKPYKLQLVGGAGEPARVLITPPASWKQAPVPLAELRRAVTTLEAHASEVSA